jgi:hypothetical protein
MLQVSFSKGKINELAYFASEDTFLQHMLVGSGFLIKAATEAKYKRLQ